MYRYYGVLQLMRLRPLTLKPHPLLVPSLPNLLKVFIWSILCIICTLYTNLYGDILHILYVLLCIVKKEVYVPPSLRGKPRPPTSLVS